ncbi:hypothetical protein RA307_20130 [Xanthobacteraceae bacterium Astr-EGSB]|uniref:hypothetical protein n=1 Tax=Astrobacterium formosum TaxID=3069710 RepID=UPI0027B83424|nr:hypothetical protein [Xanthobacteraceae bacterium Astr-EGSB]
MIRMLTVATLVLASMPALAQSEVPKGDGAGDERRYQFNPVEGGTLRLDTRSGQVSLCSRRAGGWVCALVADDRNAFEQEIARLQADNGRLQSENGRLKQSLLDRGAPLPDGAAPPAERGEATPAPRRDEIDRVMSALERAWRRLVDMIGNLQKDMGKS